MSATESELRDLALLDEVDLARAAAQEEAGDEEVGAHVGTHIEADTAVTHLFETVKPGYHGWRWAVTVASAGPDTDVTISEVVLLPGPEALVAPDWVPWENRVQAGDLGVGDLLPTAPDDARLVPAYVESDDPAVEEEARDVGLGRSRVMARPARLDAATRWQHSEFGPRSDMARSAPAHCGTCGFYLPLAGSLRAAFGTCGNEISPADGHVVHTEYGCGAHSEAEVEQVSPVLVANLIYDDALLDVEPIATPEPTEAATAPADAAEATPAEEAVAKTTPAEATAAEEPPAETATTEALLTGEAPPADAAITEATAAEQPPTGEATAETFDAEAAVSGGALEAGPAAEASPAGTTVTRETAAEADATEGPGKAELSTEARPAEAPSAESPAAVEAASGVTETEALRGADEVGPESPSPVGSIAPPRELPGPGPAAEAQLSFAALDGPPASEPVAPLEAVVTAETVIDAPGEAGAPSALTPWIRPEGAARAGETAAESSTQANVPDDDGTPAETEVSDRGGLLTGGLLGGGLLSGGLLRNSHTLAEAETSDQGDAAMADQPSEVATRENEAPAQAEDSAPSDADAPDQGHAEALGQGDASSDAEAPGQPTSADVPDQGRLAGNVEVPGQTRADDTEALDHRRTPGDTEARGHSRRSSETETPDRSRTPGDTKTPDHSRTLGDTEAPGRSRGPSDTETPDHSRAPGDTETPGPSGVEGEASAEEHHPWEPTFRPYWMRSADGRRTEGD